MYRHFTVRLTGGPSDREGLVQVYYDSTWGHICDENWDKQGADVVCRALGYTSSSDSNSGANYGSGNGVYWLNNVQCVGNEESILSCAHDGLKKQGCPNGKEARVVCAGPEGKAFFNNNDVCRFPHKEVFAQGSQ